MKGINITHLKICYRQPKWIVAIVCVFLQACQTVPYQGQARNVNKKPQESGVIAIATDYRPEDRSKADDYMKQNCSPFPVKVMEEGEVAVGQKTSASSSETDRASTKTNVGSFLGMPVFSGKEGGKDATSNSVVTNVNEWQIKYECVKSVSSSNEPTHTPTKKK